VLNEKVRVFSVLSIIGYHYFDVVVVFAWLKDPESYAGGSVATGRVSHTRQVIDDDQEEKRYPGPPCWVVGARDRKFHALRKDFI